MKVPRGWRAVREILRMEEALGDEVADTFGFFDASAHVEERRGAGEGGPQSGADSRRWG